MAIFVNADTKVLVQGLTGGQGKYHGLRNRAYGTQVVAGVTPGKGGQDVEGIPVYDSVAQAVAATGATASFIAVRPRPRRRHSRCAAAGIGFVWHHRRHTSQDRRRSSTRSCATFPNGPPVWPELSRHHPPGSALGSLPADRAVPSRRTQRHRVAMGR